nr:ATP-dependent helicase [Candidatus Buchananbacteria bacterium]
MAERAEVFESRYAQLNEAQQQAVDAIEGPLLVIAGPGSGKTELLSLRVANILRQTDVWPSNILCLTFTDAAAANMRQRLIGLIGSEAYRVAIFTFHSFSVEIINRHPEYFYHGASYVPASDLVQFDLLTSIIEQLPHDNPLRSHHPDQGYVYLREIRSLVAHIKRAGLSPLVFKEILAKNKLSAQELNIQIHELLSPRLAKQLLPDLKTWAESLLAPQSNEIYSPLALVIGQSLANAVNHDLEQGSTKFTSEWKRKYTRKDETGNLILAESYYQPKLESLADVYLSYQESLHQHGYYDYDDMILDVIEVLDANKNLRYEIGERYQYILVDEFQDTNDAQLRLLQLITDTPLGNDPNVMAVGDDDQAVFKFQGAQLRNITAFTGRYQQPKFISLAHNYRSQVEIIAAAQRVIADSAMNLQSIFPELTKQYISARGEGGELHHFQCHTIAEQYQQVVQFVKTQLEQGTAPSEIAIISRRHKDLEAIVPYLLSANLPIHYEKQQSVFDVPPIHQLITICQYLTSIAEQKPADYLLPEILSYEFWQLPRELVWNVSLDCKREHRQWLELMLEHQDERIKSIAAWLLDLGARARVEPATMIISRVIGGETIADDDIGNKSIATSAANPFKQYYFSQQNSVQYLEFLAALKTFIQAFSEHSSGRPVLLVELLKFVEMYHKNNLQLTTTNQFQLATEAITLVTAHKAKGQEFKCVAIINANDDIWFKGGAIDKLRLPSNLPLVPLPDDEDDARRLLYVAMTRAKNTLAFFSSAVTETGKATPELRYLPELPQLQRHECAPSADATQLRQLLEFPWQQYHVKPMIAEEPALFKSVLDHYQLSITHLQAFTNVIDNGPQLF